MKTSKPQKFNLIEGGMQKFEESSGFRRKVDEIRREVTRKYLPALANEKNGVRRIFIKIKIALEIRKRIHMLSSLKNLHVVNG